MQSLTRPEQVAASRARFIAHETTPVFHAGRPGTSGYAAAQVALPAVTIAKATHGFNHAGERQMKSGKVAKSPSAEKALKAYWRKIARGE